MAIDGNRSTFKSANSYSIDTFTEMFDISASDASAIEEWKSLKIKTSRTTEEEARFTTLTNQLKNKLFSAENYNKLLDCIVNLENLYVDKGLTQINQTINEYVQNYAQTDINNTLGGYVQTLLLTNATRVIISSTTPTVVNGALWVKPKTV